MREHSFILLITCTLRNVDSVGEVSITLREEGYKQIAATLNFDDIKVGRRTVSLSVVFRLARMRSFMYFDKQISNVLVPPSWPWNSLRRRPGRKNSSTIELLTWTLKSFVEYSPRWQLVGRPSNQLLNVHSIRDFFWRPSERFRFKGLVIHEWMTEPPVPDINTTWMMPTWLRCLLLVTRGTRDALLQTRNFFMKTSPSNFQYHGNLDVEMIKKESMERGTSNVRQHASLGNFFFIARLIDLMSGRKKNYR